MVPRYTKYESKSCLRVENMAFIFIFKWKSIYLNKTNKNYGYFTLYRTAIACLACFDGVEVYTESSLKPKTSHTIDNPEDIVFWIVYGHTHDWPYHREEMVQRGNTRQIVSRRYIQSIYYRKLY